MDSLLSPLLCVMLTVSVHPVLLFVLISSVLPQMVFEAIKALKERNGSSLAAIKKYMVNACPDLTTKFAPHQLRAALKKGTESGKFIKVCFCCLSLCR